MCDIETSLCTGFNQTSSCFEHDQCDLKLGCIANENWPFNKSCEPLRQEGQRCNNDFDCDLDKMCWYKTEADSQTLNKTCLLMFSQEDFTEFGYKEQKRD